MSRVREFWSHRLSGSADVESESNDDAAITPLLSVLGSLAQEFVKKYEKITVKAFSHFSMAWIGSHSDVLPWPIVILPRKR